MIIPITQLRKQIFTIFRKIDTGEEVTIVKRDTGKRYKIIAAPPEEKDLAEFAKKMAAVNLKPSFSPQEMKGIFESRYDD
jgi:hypothetical protein